MCTCPLLYVIGKKIILKFLSLWQNNILNLKRLPLVG